MLRFKTLRLSGFKSFVEAADLSIELGLTGIVGPNGCGKSNLVEALRWVMGETSAKQMRGGEMDDVIFGGTRDRPPRNIAEVILNLDNSARVAPAPFNEFDELEISRRIEKDKGSTYRINGREVRARDVQLLFADSATGARSTAMVSQGRIGAVIAAKPVERRLLLEEAAGITGLHSRRHEAELRLRGAETNLERLDDIMVTLEAQLAHLKKQARQATRYRNLSDHIHKAEATLFYLRWTAEEEALEAASKALAEMGGVVAGLTGAVSSAAAAQAAGADELPAKRLFEAEAAAELQRLTVVRDGLEAEEQRINAASADGRVRLDETAADIQREQAFITDGDAALKRLAEEKGRIDTPQEGEENARAEAAQDLAAANAQVEKLDDKLTGLTTGVANDEARRNGLALKIEDLKIRKERLTVRGRDIAEQRERLETEVPDAAALAEAEWRFEDARTKLEQAQAGVDVAEQARTEAVGNTNATVAESHAAAASATRFEAQVEALAEVLDAGDDDRWPPLIDALRVEPGYEAALGVALGKDLTASDDEAAPSHWRALGPLANPPALPAGVRLLSDFIRGSAVLDRRLAQIGVVDSEAEGRRLAPDLAQGQRLVSRDGALWRWDGFTVSANAATVSQAWLDQRKRLNAAREKLAESNAAAKVAEDRLATVRQAEKDAIEAAEAARAAWAAADNAYGVARDALTEAKERSAGHGSHLTLLNDQAATIEAELEHLEADDKEALEALEAIPDPTAKREQIEDIRAELGQRRSHQVECQSRHDSLDRSVEERHQRLADNEAENASWQGRRDAAEARTGLLDERRRDLESELKRLATRPAEIAEQRGSLFGAIDKAEATRKGLADRLAEAESALLKADAGLRTAEAELAGARENMVRAEGSTEHAKQACHVLAERIKDRLECPPDQLFEFSGLKPDADLPDLEAVERKVERLIRERETMGPVNLRADQEAEELKDQIETMGTERDDLLKAIDKLRRGISELNREGRQRLLASFEEVNTHFQKLFERLFAGGRAYLELTESDDPLEAGLEIMASPPGKRLQMLSLLSGGEQALTALALLFAVFQTNPAPICVLDEVDAPLDDANVDRFCTLLEGMAKTDETRFIIITHHRMTMARMDRLFGVTMFERGVSQLVSVDLQRAEKLKATA